ncbi:MAG TPA: hypothetical protein VHY37_09085 [Tepidisphaeraceae bacterium]|jgi:hypothetical protein|nr:hypothetical protein [Tepidisphaeraceae bacterium]
MGRTLDAAMPLAILLALAVAMSIARPTAAQATAPSTQSALSSEEQNLLHHLETGTWRQRQDAVKELINRGAWEIPAVTRMLAITKSPDAKARLQALLRRLIHDRALGPSLITMHFKNAPAKAVYAELFRQAWAPLLTTPDNLLDDPALPRITIDVAHKPFWLVMQRLESTTGLGLASQPDGYRLRRGARIARGPVAISGPLLVVLADIRPALIDGQGYWFDFSVYAEPKVHLLSVDQDMQVAQATDGAGAHLQQSAVNTDISPDQDYGPQQLSICLDAPNKHPGNLVRFKATTTAAIAVQSQHVEIDDLLHARQRPIQSNGVALNFLRCQKAGSVYQICFACQQDPLEQFQKINIDQPGWRLKVVDATGQVLPRAETVITGDGNINQMTMIFGPKLYGKPIAAPDRLIWNVPSEIQVVDVDVDFGNINLPLPGS